ncbi:MAG: GAF domain-containing sensor histidine kinase [Miltoncostaeaceae bacterium]
MTEATDTPSSESLDALSAIAQLYEFHKGTANALEGLTEAAVAATGASWGALVDRDRDENARLRATVNPPDGVGESLATAAARVSDEDFVDLDGASGALVMPFSAGHGARGALVLAGEGVGSASDADLELARIVVARAAGILETDALRGDLDRAMAQILETDERMMGRIGLDIHDGPTQQLSVALLEVQLLEADLDDAPGGGTDLPAELRPALMRIYETLGGALHEMRELIGHLRPAQFEDRTLDDIVRDAAVAFEARGDVTVAFDARGDFQVNGVSISQRITFYRVLQEALSNAHRHGHATHVAVTLSALDAGVELTVVDDGAGFDTKDAFRKSTRGPQSRVGLRGMRDRAQVLGGTFEITSAPGEGTTVRLQIPDWTPPERILDAS